MIEPIQLLIANPSHDGTTYNLQSQISALTYSRVPRKVKHMTFQGSIVTFNFNTLWCTALNLRAKGELTHFLLWHNDVRPRQPGWLDTLLEEMFRTQVDVLSVAIPIKDDRGLTSTAIDTNHWAPMRITQTQMLDMPVTWNAPDLLINTGLMLVDMSKPWVEEICFHMNNTITKDHNGIFHAYIESEDWNFSRQCHRLGVTLAVTRKVIVDHYGVKPWASDEVWGQEVDNGNANRIETPHIPGTFEFSYEEI